MRCVRENMVGRIPFTLLLTSRNRLSDDGSSMSLSSLLAHSSFIFSGSQMMSTL